MMATNQRTLPPNREPRPASRAPGPRDAPRHAAGRALGAMLGAYANRPDVRILTLPQGGVPVASEVAKALNAPFDLLLVRKLRVPGSADLTMGAVGPSSVTVVDREIVDRCGISPPAVDAVAAHEREERDRLESAYRRDLGAPAIADQTVILVDDGLAGRSMIRAAVLALRRQHAARIVFALPTAAPEVAAAIRPGVDEMILAGSP